jgi:hypothetical protein
MRLRDMKYIGFKHQRENKQNSEKNTYLHLIQPTSDDRLLVPEGIIRLALPSPGTLIVNRLQSQMI